MNAVEIRSLSHRYGWRWGARQWAVRDLELEVPEGSFFGLLGPNGAGKTTTLDICMNLLRPSGGEARMLDTPSQELGPEQLAKIGYVSADQRLPGHLDLDQLFAYLGPLYPTWDSVFADQLVRQLRIPRKRKIRQMSRGEKMKVSLASSMAYRPAILILDEPFSGLDAVAREDLVEGILDPTQQEGWTVVISSRSLADTKRGSTRANAGGDSGGRVSSTVGSSPGLTVTGGGPASGRGGAVEPGRSERRSRSAGRGP